MKIKLSFYYLFPILLSINLLFSCGRDNTIVENNNKKKDTTNTKASDEFKLLNSQLISDPNNAELYYSRAKLYFKKKYYDESLADMKQVLKIDSSKASYYLTLSDLYFITNKTGNAKIALEKCILLDDKNTDAMLKLAELFLYVRKHEQSMKYINMALKVNQYNAKAYFMKGMNYKELKDTAKAISSMQTAVEQDQQYYNAYIQLGLLCANKRNPLAIQYYKNAIRIQANSAEAWYNLGIYYQDIQDWDNAIKTYTSLLQIDAHNKNANYNMGVINLLNFKKYDIAINHFSNAIKMEPNYVQAYYGRAICLQSKGNVKAAAVDFQKCLDINPKFENAEIALKAINNK